MSVHHTMRRAILIALLGADGEPFTDRTLWAAVSISPLFRDRPPQAEYESARRELEAEGYLAGAVDDFEKIATWTLTTKGKHQAQKL